MRADLEAPAATQPPPPSPPPLPLPPGAVSFHFVPSAPVLRGAAFSGAFRALATVIVFGCAFWMASLWRQGSLGGIGHGGTSGVGWFGAALVLMGWTWLAILRSRTQLDAQALEQSWIWVKRMEVRELAYARVIRLRGLDWLVAPRLYVRNFSGKFAVFYAADAGLLAEFDRLAAELKNARLGYPPGYTLSAAD